MDEEQQGVSAANTESTLDLATPPPEAAQADALQSAQQAAIGEPAGASPVGAADFLGPTGEFLDKGGVAIWAIAALAILTLAIILWKAWRLSLLGVWRRTRAEAAVANWVAFNSVAALQDARQGHGIRAQVAATAMACILRRNMSEDDAREETMRVAKAKLSSARSGMRALELIATIAPLLGLFGTVLGMIAAFQQLQAAGTRADPSALAGGIWEALLTTAAGMAIAIPASAGLTWLESVTDRLRLDLEDIATRVFTRPDREVLAHAAE